MNLRRRRKYGNIKVRLDGYLLDSREEARHYRDLRSLEVAGKIESLKIHPRYVLVPAFEHRGVKYRAVTFRPDFSYYENGQLIIEDSKPWVKYGIVDEKARRKLMTADYRIRKILLIRQIPECIYREV